MRRQEKVRSLKRKSHKKRRSQKRRTRKTRAKVKNGPKVMRMAANSEHWERLTVLACTKDILRDLALQFCVIDLMTGSRPSRDCQHRILACRERA